MCCGRCVWRWWSVDGVSAGDVVVGSEGFAVYDVVGARAGVVLVFDGVAVRRCLVLVVGCVAVLCRGGCVVVIGVVGIALDAGMDSLRAGVFVTACVYVDVVEFVVARLLLPMMWWWAWSLLRWWWCC